MTILSVEEIAEAISQAGEASIEPQPAAAVPEPTGPGSSYLGIAAAFLGYTFYQRSQLQKMLKKPISKTFDYKDLHDFNQRIFYGHSKAQFVSTALPSIIAGITKGVKETELLKQNPEWVNIVATRYAEKLAESIHETSGKALVEGFIGMTNRNQPIRHALENLAEAYGVPPRTMKSILNIMTVKPPEYKTTTTPRPKTAKDRIDSMVAKAIADRAELITQTEEFSSKNLAKTIVWLHADARGEIPDSARVVWYTRKDERVCEVCGPMHSRYRKPSEPWRLPNGEQSWGPQVHPRCRCEQILVPEVTTEILRMTIDQAEQYEDSLSGEMVSKAVTASGKHDPYKRDSSGKFSSTETRQRTSRGLRVKEKPSIDPLVAAQVAQAVSLGAAAGAQRSQEAPKLDSTPKLNLTPKLDVTPKLDTTPKLTPAARLNMTPQLTPAAPLLTPAEQEPETLEGEPKLDLPGMQTPSLDTPKLDVQKLEIIRAQLEVASPKLTLDDVAKLKAEANRTISRDVSDKWVHSEQPMFTISTPWDMYDSELIDTEYRDFFPSDPEEISNEIAAYWSETIDSMLDFDDMAYDDETFDEDYQSLIFTNVRGEQLLLNRENYYDVWDSSFRPSRDGDRYEDRVIEDVVFRDIDGEMHTMDVPVADIIDHFGFGEMIDEYSPVVFIANHINQEESQVAHGGMSNPGDWRVVRLEQGMETGYGSLPYAVAYIEPIDLYDDPQESDL